MICRSGFTIIEATISFFIAILLVSLVFQFSAKFYSGLLKRSNFNSIFLENYSAFDHIVRNISQVSGNKEFWKNISHSNLVWLDSENKINKGYLVLGGALYFVTGVYENGVWTRSRKNLLSRSIKEVKFTQVMAQEAGYIKSIVCNIVLNTDKSCGLSRVIGLRNGIFI